MSSTLPREYIYHTSTMSDSVTAISISNAQLNYFPLYLQYEFQGQFLEIYNETIRDLLGEKDNNQKHEVKLAGPNTTEVIVTNLKTLPLEQENKVGFSTNTIS